MRIHRILYNKLSTNFTLYRLTSPTRIIENIHKPHKRYNLDVKYINFTNNHKISRIRNNQEKCNISHNSYILKYSTLQIHSTQFN